MTRVGDGGCRAQFPPDTPLQEVRAWLDLHRTDGGVPYLLSIPFPYRLLGSEDLPRTLQQLDLAPRASLHLRPDPAAAQSHRGGTHTTLWGFPSARSSASHLPCCVIINNNNINEKPI